ncbi:hypothetical protein ACQ4M3_39780 [Leptolyngbya sp. AN03gr2]|uniref:hypothetical protein n=1 Tax=unclassified Leptolyngbya TaxID=2650499 RepID=UPI003D323AEA
MTFNTQTQKFIDFLLTNSPDQPVDLKQFLPEQVKAFAQQATEPIVHAGQEGFVYQVDMTIKDGEHEYAESAVFFCPTTVDDTDYACAIACTHLDCAPEWSGKPVADSTTTFEFGGGEYRLVEYESHYQQDSTQCKPGKWISFDPDRLSHYYSHTRTD